MCIISMQVFLFSEAPVSIRTMFYCTVLSSWWCDIGVKSSIIFLLTLFIYRCSASKKHERGFGMRITFTVTRVVGVDTAISQTEQDCTARTIAALNTPKTCINLLAANSVSCGSFWEACLLPRNSVGPGASSTLGRAGSYSGSFLGYHVGCGVGNQAALLGLLVRLVDVLAA